MASGARPSKPSRTDEKEPTAELPRFVLVQILSLLPLKIAVRCGRVSKAWLAAVHELLSFATTLDFGERFAASLVMSPHRYSAAVDHCIALHQGSTLDAMKIFVQWKPRHFSQWGTVEAVSRIKAWLEFAASKQTKVFEAKFHTPVCLEIPGPLFDWTTLTRLSLSGCNLDPLFNPLKLSSLQELSLENVNITLEAAEYLLANCPDLTTLTLIDCRWLQEVEILSAPWLRNLMIKSKFVRRVEIEAPMLEFLHLSTRARHDNVILKALPSLRDAVMELSHGQSPETFRALLSSLIGVSSLSLAGPCYLPTMTDEVAFPKLAFVNLKRFSFEMHMANTGLRNFLQFCDLPVLENLIIVSKVQPPCFFNQLVWEPVTYAHPFPMLKEVTMDGFSICSDQMSIAVFFLKTSVCLETLLLLIDSSILFLGEDSNELLVKLQKTLEAQPKASPSAKIQLRPEPF